MEQWTGAIGPCLYGDHCSIRRIRTTGTTGNPGNFAESPAIESISSDDSRSFVADTTPVIMRITHGPMLSAVSDTDSDYSPQRHTPMRAQWIWRTFASGGAILLAILTPATAPAGQPLLLQLSESPTFEQFGSESGPSVSAVSFKRTSPEQVFGCDSGTCDGLAPGQYRDGRQGCCLSFDSEAATVLPEDNLIDRTFQTAFGVKDKFGFPIEIAGWHWWAIDTTGAGNGGYGFRGYQGTYAYTLRGGPEYELDRRQSVGAYAYFLMRDDVPYRQYYTSNSWFFEAYGWYRHEELGTLKGGLIFMKFGLDGYGNFFATSPYFEGYIQDPDYGVSWEKTWNVRDDLAVDTFAQYFFHENGQNGSLRNFDSESVARVNERNTVVLRSVGKLTLGETSSLNLGSSFLVGEIDSSRVGFADDVRTAWGVDMTWTQGPFALMGEFLQRHGRVVPTHFASGGPSDRLESYSIESSYDVGPVTWRGKYSQSFLSNPNGRNEVLSLGGQVDVTPHVTFFAEYVWWNVDGHAVAGDFNVLEGPQLTLYWHY